VPTLGNNTAKPKGSLGFMMTCRAVYSLMVPQEGPKRGGNHCFRAHSPNQTSGFDRPMSDGMRFVIQWCFQMVHTRLPKTIYIKRKKTFPPSVAVPSEEPENSLLLAPLSQNHGRSSSTRCGAGRFWLAVLLRQISTPKDVADCTADCVSSLHLTSQRFLQG
jgi:hypothetical protein